MKIKKTKNGRILIDEERQNKIIQIVRGIREQLEHLPDILSKYSWNTTAETLQGIVANGTTFLKEWTYSNTKKAFIAYNVLEASADRFARASIDDIPRALLNDVEYWRGLFVDAIRELPHNVADIHEHLTYQDGVITLSDTFIQAVTAPCTTPISEQEERTICALRGAITTIREIGRCGYLVSDGLQYNSVMSQVMIQPGLAATLIGQQDSAQELTDAEILEQMRRFQITDKNNEK